jgi:hypothetical protein
MSNENNPGVFTNIHIFLDDRDYQLQNDFLRMEYLLDMMTGGMSEERMMEIAISESLDHYKTREKKPYIKLGIEGKISDESMTNDMCTICISKFDVGENITELECKHSLHTHCIAEWVKYKSECPICRYAIITVDETPELDGHHPPPLEDGDDPPPLEEGDDPLPLEDGDDPLEDGDDILLLGTVMTLLLGR